MFTAEVSHDFPLKNKIIFSFLKSLPLKAFQPEIRVDCRVFVQDLVLHKVLRAEDHFLILDCHRQEI